MNYNFTSIRKVAVLYATHMTSTTVVESLTKLRQPLFSQFQFFAISQSVRLTNNKSVDVFWQRRRSFLVKLYSAVLNFLVVLSFSAR